MGYHLETQRRNAIQGIKWLVIEQQGTTAHARTHTHTHTCMMVARNHVKSSESDCSHVRQRQSDKSATGTFWTCMNNLREDLVTASAGSAGRGRRRKGGATYQKPGELSLFWAYLRSMLPYLAAALAHFGSLLRSCSELCGPILESYSAVMLTHLGSMLRLCWPILAMSMLAHLVAMLTHLGSMLGHLRLALRVPPRGDLGLCCFRDFTFIPKFCFQNLPPVACETPNPFLQHLFQKAEFCVGRARHQGTPESSHQWPWGAKGGRVGGCSADLARSKGLMPKTGPGRREEGGGLVEEGERERRCSR